MRTTAEEMAELGARIGRKAAAATGPTEVFWPDRGVSALDADGQAFFDAAADAACRDALDRRAAARPARPCGGSTRTSTTRRSPRRWLTGCTR